MHADLTFEIRVYPWYETPRWLYRTVVILLMIRRYVWIGLTALAIPVSFIKAPYPEQLILQHVPTLFGIGILLFAVVRFRPSGLAFYCSLVFLWLHIIGARWIYTYVPYDDFIQAVTGQTLSNVFGWKRNHYDRLVHFTSGCLGLPIFSDLLQSFCRLRALPAALLAMSCVVSIGAVYEIVEWQIAMVFSPETAEAYNGQQGDIWDAQKDLALALVGALVCLPLIWRWNAKMLPTASEA